VQQPLPLATAGFADKPPVSVEPARHHRAIPASGPLSSSATATSDEPARASRVISTVTNRLDEIGPA